MLLLTAGILPAQTVTPPTGLANAIILGGGLRDNPRAVAASVLAQPAAWKR